MGEPRRRQDIDNQRPQYYVVCLIPTESKPNKDIFCVAKMSKSVTQYCVACSRSGEVGIEQLASKDRPQGVQQGLALFV